MGLPTPITGQGDGLIDQVLPPFRIKPVRAWEPLQLGQSIRPRKGGGGYSGYDGYTICTVTPKPAEILTFSPICEAIPTGYIPGYRTGYKRGMTG